MSENFYCLSSEAEAEIIQDYLDNMSLSDLEASTSFAHPDDNFTYVSPKDLEEPFSKANSYIKCNQVNMKQINRDIRAFVTDPACPKFYSFPPMEKAIRKRIHSISLLYNLESKSKGKARERYLFLTRTATTKKATNFAALDRLIEMPIFSGEKGPGPAKESAKERKKREKERTSSKPKAGSIVAHSAMPIDADNFGNKLMRKMGWMPGAGLGPQEKGLKEPLQVVYKPDKRGLGSS
jgi:hypothetical protein